MEEASRTSPFKWLKDITTAPEHAPNWEVIRLLTAAYDTDIS